MVSVRFRSPLFAVIVAAAIAVRLLLIPNPGFEADISFWKSWGLATVDFGAVEGIKVTNNNYPTPFSYTLGILVGIYRLFADPHNFSEFWSNTNTLFLAIAKMLPILADFGIAWLLVYIGKHAKRLGFPEIKATIATLPFYTFLAAVYLLSPLSLIDGAWWGQVDSVGVFMFLLAVVVSLSGKPALSGFIFMAAMMTKLQNMIYGPLFFLFIWQRGGFPALVSAACGAAIGFFGLNIEFLLTRNMDRVMASLTENYDYFPWMSLMAYNVWWIVSGGHGLATSDKLTVLGLLNAKTVGLVLFSSFYLFATLRQFLSLRFDGKSALAVFFENLVIVNGAFFLFQTQSHDRYAFPLALFLLLWFPFIVTNRKGLFTETAVRTAFTLYGCFTALYFYNLHTALAVNYPHNGIPFLSSATGTVPTVATAYALLLLFAVFVFSLIRSTRTSGIAALTSAAVAGILLYVPNLSLIRKAPVSLTRFTPYISEQAYGSRQTDKAVQSSFGGPYKWTRLSVQYLFYDKGIGTHANSKHVFDIRKRFTRFTTDYGIDTEAGTKATAVFEIYGDDRLLFRSPVMGRFDVPGHAEIDITGITRLTLVTTDAGDGNYDDHTDWLNPTLIP